MKDVEDILFNETFDYMPRGPQGKLIVTLIFSLSLTSVSYIFSSKKIWAFCHMKRKYL